MTEPMAGAVPKRVQESREDRIGRAIARLCVSLRRTPEGRGLSPGDQAELRRLDPLGGALPPIFWRLVVEPAVASAIDDFEVDGDDRERVERAFAIVVQAMAEAGTAGARPVGAVLADTGYAEERFVRFLRARGRDAVSEARHVAHWCAVKGAGLRFEDAGARSGFARFVLAAFLDRDAAPTRAHAIARDYFRGLSRSRHDDTNENE